MNASPLAERLLRVDESIAEAARAAGREPSEITRIVITKFHPASLVDELYDLGVRDFGENRQQELSAKVVEVGDKADLRWHFVGQAQTNKASQVRAVASAVHSIDRIRIANAFDKAGLAEEILDVLLQVNLTDDPGRGGVNPGELDAFASHVAGLSTLRVRGLMAVAPLGEDPRPAFERVAGLSAQLRRTIPDATWLSMGMTADFADAIAAGATHLRIGSAITGPRPDRG